jgi:hypothetical protein
MKKRSTNIFAYAFQLVALVLVYSHAPQQMNKKNSSGGFKAGQQTAVAVIVTQAMPMAHPAQLPVLLHILYR